MFACKRPARERDAATARAAILRAAEATFARDGYSGARIDAIATASGYNKALLFHYFHGGKRELYQVVVGRANDEINARLAEFLAPFGAGDGIDAARLRAFIEDATRWWFDFYMDHPTQLHVLLWEAAEGWGTFTSLHDPSQLTWLAATVALIERARDAGIVRHDVDPEMLLAHVVGMGLIYHGSLPRYTALFPSAALDTPEGLRRAREQLVAMVRAALLAPVPDPSGLEATHAARV